MADLTAYAASPPAFVFRYIRLRPISHAIILAAVLGAVACSVCTQYGVKFLVDTLSSGADAAAWSAFLLLGALIAADNLLWRVAAVIAGIMVLIMFRLAAAGRPLHHDFARKAAAVDGEMIDVVSNMSLVRAFGGFLREHRRFDATINREMAARRRSLFYLEKLRIFHAVVTILLTLGLVAWAIML